MQRVNVGIPSGAIFPFAGTAEPEGFMFCDGRSLSRAAYPGLFSVIGTAHGAVDGNSFNIPDYRGRFLRGVDGAAGVDPDKAARTAMKAGGATGNNVGSVQGHGFGSHTHIQDSHNHSQNPHSHYVQNDNAAGGVNNYSSGGVSYRVALYTSDTTASNNPTTATNQNTGGNETRPVNAYVNYIIKA